MEAQETFEHNGVTIKIIQDTDAESPEYGDKNLFLIAGHRDFYVPEPGEKRLPSDFSEIAERYADTHWMFPIEAYIHSGVALAFSRQGNFPDRQWDVSQVGAIFAAKSEWRLSASARKAAESLLESWNQYLSGDVWGYVAEKDSEEDSCWGVYGIEYAREQAKKAADCVAKRCEREAIEAHRCACADIATVH